LPRNEQQFSKRVLVNSVGWSHILVSIRSPLTATSGQWPTQRYCDAVEQARGVRHYRSINEITAMSVLPALGGCPQIRE
jgi:hypothetical protein